MKNRSLALFVIVLATIAGFATWWSVQHATPAAMPVVLDAPAETRGASIAATTATNSSAEARTTTRQFLDANASADGASIGVPCRIEGRALDTRGAPVARADVTVSTRAETWRAIADPDGRFAVDALVTESGNLVLELAGGAWLARTHWTLDVTPEAGDFVLVEGRNDVGNLLLEDRGAIEGRVIDATQQPVSGAHVVVTFEMGGDEEAATTDAKGLFRIGGLPGGERMMLASGDGWAPMQPTPVQVVVRETTRVADVVLRALPSIRGVVVDEHGVPAVGAVIEGREDPDVTGVTAISGAGGAFVLWLDRAVPHRIVVVPNEEFDRPPAMREAKSSPAPNESNRSPHVLTGPSTQANEAFLAVEPVAPGREDVQLVVHRRFQVTFHVVDRASGRPIETFGLSAQVDVDFRRVWRDDRPCEFHARGDVRCVAAPGQSVVCVWAPGHAPHVGRVTIDTGASDVQTIAMLAGARIRGRVTIRDEPVADVQLTLRRQPQRKSTSAPDRGPASPASSGSRASGPASQGETPRDDLQEELDLASPEIVERSGSDGSFEFRELAAGAYVLNAVHKDAAPASLGSLRVDVGGVLNLGDVILAPAASIRGRLIPPSDEKASGFTVYLRRAESSRHGQPESERELVVRRADGTFEFGQLAAGSWRVDWARPSASARRGDPTIIAGVDVTLEAGDMEEIVLDASGSAPSPLEVRVVRGREPVAGARVRLTWVREETKSGENESMRRTLASRTELLGVTDASGTLSTKIESGVPFRLEVFDARWMPLARDTELHTGVPRQLVSCTFEAQVGTIVLEIPAYAAPKPMESVMVNVRTASSTHTLVLPPSTGVGGAQRSWQVGTNQLGDLATGEYEVDVDFEESVTVFRTTDPERPRALQPKFRTRIKVVAGQEARIVVP